MELECCLPADRIHILRHIIEDYQRHERTANRADTVRVAAFLGIQEDYEGIWSEDFFLPLRQMLDDMIEESQP